MLLVPRQLRRSGMTGDVPYYGGRFTPAQAYAASHPSRRPAPPPPPPARPAPPPAPPRPESAAVSPGSPGTDPRLALEHLRDAGVITPAEYADLCARVPE
jgi:hypothetical protein